ncbi:hypothetical protein [Armatimonas sp.]|uniref:hypothetical protein n=1 Tax=Armatimonas sp. TaxID=1872638 RepID=UPI00374DF3B8
MKTRFAVFTVLACLSAVGFQSSAHAGNWTVQYVQEDSTRHVCDSGTLVGNATNDPITIVWGYESGPDTEEVQTPCTRFEESSSFDNFFQNATAVKSHGSILDNQPAGVSMYARVKGQAEFAWDANATQNGTIPGNTGTFQVNWTKHWNFSHTNYSGSYVAFNGGSPRSEHEGHTYINSSPQDDDLAFWDWETESGGGGFTASGYDTYSFSAYATWQVEFNELPSF